MDKNKSSNRVSEILLLALSAFFLIGMLTFLGPCGPKDDGTWMTCHWAGQALKGVAAVWLVISVLHLLVKDPKAKMGLSLAAIPTALLGAILPGNLIGLCMMNTMRCHSVMRTSAIILSVLVIVVSAYDAFVQSRR